MGRRPRYAWPASTGLTCLRAAYGYLHKVQHQYTTRQGVRARWRTLWPIDSNSNGTRITLQEARQ